MVGRAIRNLIAGVALAAALAAPAEACRLALAFALDVSASVDRSEYKLQLQGLADGLSHPSVSSAILAPGGGVALAAYEWSGQRQQVMIVDWTLITDRASLEGFVEQLAAHQRRYGEFPTAVGYALAFGHGVMRRAPRCERQVIDISGDGTSNDGFGPDSAYKAFDFGEITVNGLVIGAGDLELISFYRDVVTHGPEAFIEVARDYADFPRAMLRKLLREISHPFVAQNDHAPDGRAGSRARR